MAEIEILCQGVDHAECVAWDPAGNLVFGTEGGEIWALDVNTRAKRRVAVVGGFVLGVAVDGDGDIHACIWGNRSVTRCSPSTGLAAIESLGADDHPFITPNHLAFHPNGSLYVSDSGTSWEARDGAILRIDPTGRAMVVSREAPAFPNGIAVDESGSFLYVLESSEPRLSRFRIGDDGLLGPAKLVVDLPRTVPDGLAFVSDGSIVISLFKPDAILRFSDGQVEVLAEDWQGRFLNSPTNLCFFGEDLGRLAVANIGAQTIAEVMHPPAPGISLHYPRVQRDDPPVE